MYAIVNIAGQQFKVEKNQKLFVHRLATGEGENISFDRVLLIENDSKISLGDPVIKGASVSAKVLSHVKGDKVLVFKKKRRKGYQKLNGHRQYLTQIQIEDILPGGKGGKKAESHKVKEEGSKAAAKEEPVEQPKAEPVEQTKAKPVDEPVVEPEATAGDGQATESNGEPEVKARATRSKPGKAQAKKDVKPEPASETATGEKDAE